MRKNTYLKTYKLCFKCLKGEICLGNHSTLLHKNKLISENTKVDVILSDHTVKEKALYLDEVSSYEGELDVSGLAVTKNPNHNKKVHDVIHGGSMVDDNTIFKEENGNVVFNNSRAVENSIMYKKNWFS